MTERHRRRRLVDFSVVAVSVAALGGGVLVAADVDRDRVIEAGAEPLVASPKVAPTTQAPLPGLIPAVARSHRARRVVVVRRSRAS